MITLLDTVGPAVWRASWQAAVLAIVVLFLMRSFGERITPRWRFLLWSVVVLRLLFVVTPASPWSAFNLVGIIPGPSARRPVLHEAGPKKLSDTRAAETDVAHYVGPRGTGPESPRTVEAVANPPVATRRAPAISPLISVQNAGVPTRPIDRAARF